MPLCYLQVSPEVAQRLLKDLIFSQWESSKCEERVDTVKMLSLIDFFLPFLPLDRSHVRRLFQKRLVERANELRRERQAELAWDGAVVDYLTAKVGMGIYTGDTGIREARAGRLAVHEGKELCWRGHCRCLGCSSTTRLGHLMRSSREVISRGHLMRSVMR